MARPYYIFLVASWTFYPEASRVRALWCRFCSKTCNASELQRNMLAAVLPSALEVCSFLQKPKRSEHHLLVRGHHSAAPGEHSSQEGRVWGSASSLSFASEQKGRQWGWSLHISSVSHTICSSTHNKINLPRF